MKFRNNMRKKLVLVIFLLLTLFGCKNTSKSVEFKSFRDLSGKMVGVQNGTLYEDDLLKKVPDANIERFTDPNTMLIALSKGKLDAYITESGSSVFERKQYPDLTYMNEPIAYTKTCVGIGETPKKDLLLKQMNEFISKCRKDGTIDRLNEYWVDNLDEDNNVTDKTGLTHENGEIIVAVEGSYVPFSYTNKGEPEGYDIDFIYRFCREYGYTPVIEMMEYDALSPTLSTGKCDLAMNIVYNLERSEEVTLSDSYYDISIIIGYFKSGVSSKAISKSIVESFEKTFIRDSRWKQFLSGALVTLLISFVSILAGTIIGLLLYIICRRGGKVINIIMDKISWLVEGTPTVLLLMIFYFIVFGNVNIEKVIVAIITFTIMFTVSMFSMLKNGEDAIGKGQLEAALSQGFSELQAYLLIVLPQSAIHFLPQYFGEVVSLIKDTSIVGYIAILDLTKVSDMIRGRTFEPFFPLISTAIIYFLLSWLLNLASKRIYQSLSPKTRDLNEAFKDIDRHLD